MSSFLLVVVLADIPDSGEALPHRFQHSNSSQQHYADTWVVHIPAGRARAQEIAERAGFRLLGQVVHSALMHATLLRSKTDCRQPLCLGCNFRASLPLEAHL